MTHVIEMEGVNLKIQGYINYNVRNIFEYDET